ncbi:MAG: exostosin family protein, partial [Terracidiphilus sp.]
RNRGLDESGGAASQKRWLFSFKGGSTSLLRKRLFRTDFGRADVLVENMSAYRHWEDDQGNRLEWQRSYARTLRESHFALCPRGAGAGSIRFFEAMEMGVAPVLLSDHYLLPEGPAWESFLIKMPERRIRQLPEMLEERRGESAELGLRARQAWETWFSATSAFNNIVDAAWKTVQAAKKKQGFLKATQGVTIARYRAFVAGRAMARGAALGAMRALGKDPARFGVSGPK